MLDIQNYGCNGNLLCYYMLLWKETAFPTIIITKILLTSHTLYFGSFPDQYSLVTSIGGGGMS